LSKTLISSNQTLSNIVKFLHRRYI